ncbi:MAG: energy-coupling factor transporter ATPase [Clostridiales Family XIII bacterium]|jgi:energy-coupling factor transport system ATP-binding protein|nr:energy-coupling factor transporter ATPase [Clostridiales Family XIII bacterium]
MQEKEKKADTGVANTGFDQTIDNSARPEGKSFIEIGDLVFEYRRESDIEGGPDVVMRAIDGVSLAVERGSFTAIIGRNGSGKSTLAKNINALFLPASGTVQVDGMDTRDDAFVWEIRRRVGMVFQNPDNQLVSAVVEDDVAFGPENLGVAPDEIRERIRFALDAVDMSDHRKMAPHLLSGGQKQRVAIAGVVAMRPDAIIFDEPTAMLDPEGRHEVMDVIARLHAEGITVVLITHFMEETVNADRIVIMDRGRVALDGAPAAVFQHAAEIDALGLRLPFVVDLAARLRARGIAVPEGLLTQETLANSLRARGRGAFSTAGSESNTDEPSPCVAQVANTNEPSPCVLTESPKIKVEHLTHTYNAGLAYETKAVDDVSFEVADGEFIGIIGHTGSGKSTLIQHLNGILKPDSGRILIGDTDITDKAVKMPEIRKRVGLSFQYPEYQLFEETVYKDIAFGPKNLGLSGDAVDERVREAMDMVNLDFDEIAERSPFELSGGQKRSAAIAGVIAMRPDVLILDEPTAGLDPRSHEDILNMIRSVRQRTGSVVILVSHNMGDIAAMSDRVFVMDSGKLVRAGTPAEIFADADYLRSVGLGLPPATEMAERLDQGEQGFGADVKGSPVPALRRCILEMDELVEAIVAAEEANVAVPETNVAAEEANVAAVETNVAVPETNVAAEEANVAVVETNVAAEEVK